MLSFHQPHQYNGVDIDEELTLPIQMPETPPPASAPVPKHHIISIIDFMRHTRHFKEHRIFHTDYVTALRIRGSKNLR